MNGRQTTPQPRRAVVFTSCAPGQGLGGPVESAPGCVPTPSAYEAAAELLAGPATALVVDLRLLRPAHIRLIEIARRVGAELVGVGPLPAWASSDQLGGMRLVGRGQLSEVLRASSAGKPAPSGRAAARPGDQRGTYKPQGPAPQGPAAGGEPLLTAEELDALLGDVT